MGRALLVAALGAPLLAWSWMSLESGRDAGQATLVVLLAIAAALVRPRSARIAACVIALLARRRDRLRRRARLGAARPHALALRQRLPRVLRLPDAVRPGRAPAHARRAAGRAVRVHARLRAGGGRPPAGPCRDRAGRRRRLAGDAAPGPRPAARRACCWSPCSRPWSCSGRARCAASAPRWPRARSSSLAALAATSSPAFAKRAFLDWQHWDLYTKPAKPVDVSYVWNSSYSGLTFHGKPTTVMRVKAGPETHYWRVSVLNTVEHGMWFEEISPVFGDPPVPLGQAGLVPPRELRQDDWEEQHVTIEALRDHRLPGGSVPVRFAPGGGVGSVSYDPTGVAIADDAALARGYLRRLELRAEADAGAARAPRSRSTRARSWRRTTSTARWSRASTRGCSASRTARPTFTT